MTLFAHSVSDVRQETAVFGLRSFFVQERKLEWEEEGRWSV